MLTLLRNSLYIGFFLVPFAMVAPFLNPEATNYYAYYCICLFLGIALQVLNARLPRIDEMLVFLMWIIISSLVTEGTLSKENYDLFLFPATALGLYWILTTTGRDQDIITFLKLLMGFAVIEALIGTSQSFFEYPVFSIGNPVVFGSERNVLGYVFRPISPYVMQGTGTYEHFNGLGALFSLTFPVVLGFWWARRSSYKRLFVFIIVAMGTVTTFSRSALLGAVAGVTFIYAGRSRSPRITFIGISIVVLIMLLGFAGTLYHYYGSTENLSIRFYTWKYAVDVAFSDPEKLLLGFGYGYFKKKVLSGSGVMEDLHSGQLQIFMELGLVGLGLFVIFYGRVLCTAWKKRRDVKDLSIAGGLVSFFISQAFDNSMFSVTNGCLMVCLLGLLKRDLVSPSLRISWWWYGIKDVFFKQRP